MADAQRDYSAELIRAVADLEDDEALRLVRERVARGDDAFDIVEDCRRGMVEVGQRYEQRQYFLSGLILAGEILREVMEIVLPLTERKFQRQPLGLVLLGTVHGDIHDAGKDLFQVMLKVHGFQVYDLGVDVAPERFLQKALELQPAVIGLSCLIVGSYSAMRDTIALLRADPRTAGIPRIIGGQVNEEVCQYAGADAWATDAMDGVKWCLRRLARDPFA